MSQPLSLWEETPTKPAILDFVGRVTADSAKARDFLAYFEPVENNDNIRLLR